MALEIEKLVEHITEDELIVLKTAIEEKLNKPICPCCNKRCGNFKAVNVVKEDLSHIFEESVRAK